MIPRIELGETFIQRRNALIARRRAPVEAVFSALKRLYGGARTPSLRRNLLTVFVIAMGYLQSMPERSPARTKARGCISCRAPQHDAQGVAGADGVRRRGRVRF